MKTIKLLSVLAFAALFMTGCSDEETYAVDYEFLDSLTRGASSCYDFDSYTVYDKAEKGGSKWKKKDISYMTGISVPGPRQILIQDGKTCLPLNLSSSIHGSHPIALPLESYRRLTKYDSKYMITSPFNIIEGNKINLNGEIFEILSASKDCIKLVSLSEYYNSEGIKKGTWKFVITYKSREMNSTELEKNLYYESKSDALLDIIRMLRARFGDILDVNPYFRPQMELDYSVFDLKKIEENILAGNDEDMRGVCYSSKDNRPLIM